MLGKLNIASLCLIPGAMGQYWFYGRSFPSAPEWVILLPLFLPWLTTFTFTIAKRPPFGPRPFRFFLLIVMCWYALVTILAEGMNFYHPLPSDGHITIVMARVLMYFGLLCFLPFIRAYILLRQQESAQNTRNSLGKST